MKFIKDLVKDLDIKDFKQQSELVYLGTVEKNKLVHTLSALKNYYNFTHLVLLTAVDWLEEGKFQLTYIVHNREEKIDFALRVFIDRKEATMDSVHFLWPAIKTYQRELREMFGIDFPHSPGVNESFILEGWDYDKNPPPYRRDFNTVKYSEDTYFERPGRKTYDPAKYMKEQLYKKFPNSADLEKSKAKKNSKTQINKESKDNSSSNDGGNK